METTNNTTASSLWTMHSEEEIRTTFESLTEKDFTIFDDISAIPIKEMYSDGYAAVFCRGGKGQVSIDGKEYAIGVNDLFLCQPNLFINNVMISCDFKFWGILMSKQYFQSVLYFPGKIWQASFDVMKSPVIHLDERETEGFSLSYGMIRHKLSRTDMPHHEESIKLLLQSLVYDMYDIIAPKLQIDSDLGNRHSSAETLFGRFMNMVSAESPHRHSVSYYADKLCITPKYLSSICKLQSKKTASEIIDESTVNYIKQMLRSSDMTIKEIANDTGFENLSFFGKFVKRELGMSPRDYRING